MSRADAEIYLAAAKLMAETTEPGENEFSCNCIQRVAGNSILRKRYEEVFGRMLSMPTSSHHYLLIRDVEQAAGGQTGSQRCRDFRVLMLCMMAAIVEEDDDLG